MKILENFLWKGLENEIQNDKLILLSSDFNDAIEANLKTLEKENKTLKSPKYDQYLLGACLLPGKILFCYGYGYNFNRIEWNAYLINEKLDIQVLPSGLPNHQSIAAYHDNFVYIFNYLSITRFNLIKKKWKNLGRAIPWPGYWCSSVSFNDFILVSRYGDAEIFVLDLVILSLSWISGFLEKNASKILCKSEQVAYIIDFSGKIFESEIFNSFKWNVIGTCSSLNYRMHGHKVFYKNSYIFH